MRLAPGKRGQGLLEYVLLIGLLGVIAGGALIIIGPGVDNVYSEVNRWLSGAEAAQPPAGVPTPTAQAFTPTPAATAICADITIAGSASFRDLNRDGQAETIRFGGASNCGQISGASSPGDPLVSQAQSNRLRCVALDPITLDLNHTQGAGGAVVFKPLSTSITLKLHEKRGGPILLSANLSLGALTLSTSRGALTVASVAGLQVDNRISSPTLNAFAAAPATQASFSFSNPSNILIFDAKTGRYRLAARSVPYTLKLSTVCRR